MIKRHGYDLLRRTGTKTHEELEDALGRALFTITAQDAASADSGVVATSLSTKGRVK